MKLNGSSSKPGISELTFREREILMLIFEEKTNKEISEELFISKRTVECHRERMMEKLCVKSIVGLIKVAYEIINAIDGTLLL